MGFFLKLLILRCTIHDLLQAHERVLRQAQIPCCNSHTIWHLTTCSKSFFTGVYFANLPAQNP